MAADPAEIVVVGCGLTGMTIARQLAEAGFRVHIYEKRDHVGGNMHDFRDQYGFMVQQYGPHTFHTKDKLLFDYVGKFEKWNPYYLMCGAVFCGQETPSPFNFKTIDQFFSAEKAKEVKRAIKEEYGDREMVTVIEALQSKNHLIEEYAQFLFDHDYSLYTAKQWNVSPKAIDPSVLKRVPLRMSYREGYFDDEYQVMPAVSFDDFSLHMLNHKNIIYELNKNAFDLIELKNGKIKYLNSNLEPLLVIYTGPIDELFGFSEGELPYRSLKFVFKHTDDENFQKYAVTAYPEAKGYTRITNYRHLPEQKMPGCSYAIEYSLAFDPAKKMEPYYPVLTEKSIKLYGKYEIMAAGIDNLCCAGRLAKFRYYNMDQALGDALKISDEIISRLRRK